MLDAEIVKGDLAKSEVEPDNQEEARIVEEEVGYAKILVLNREYYTALEKKFLEKDSSLKLYNDDGSLYKVKTQKDFEIEVGWWYMKNRNLL